MSTDVGFEDAEYLGRFEWWRHEPSGVTVAVRLDDRGAVTGAVRPTDRRDLREHNSAMGFEWDEDPTLRRWVEAHRPEFESAGQPTDMRRQRPDISDDVDALTAS